MSMILLLILVYLGLYIVLSIPAVQERIKERVCDETSGILGGRFDVRQLTVRPFSEVLLSDVTLLSPKGERCAHIRKVAAGIDLWTLFSERRIVLNYAELIGLNADISQKCEGGVYNIQFLIDALSPKDKDKPSALFDLKIRNIVVRDSKASFHRPWLKASPGFQRRLADIEVNRLRMDLSIPVLRNDFFRFDIRNIQFVAMPGVSVRNMSAQILLIKDAESSQGDRIIVKDFKIGLPHSTLALGDIDLRMNAVSDIGAILNGRVTPADFSELLPQLDVFDTPWNIDIDASVRGRSVSVSKFQLEHLESNSLVSFSGSVGDLQRKDSLDVSLSDLKVDLSPTLISEAMSLIPGISEKGKQIIKSAGRVTVELEGSLHSGETAEATGGITTSAGSLDFTASVRRLHSQRPQFNLMADAEDIELSRFIGHDKFGKVSANIEANVVGIDRHAEGHIDVKSDECYVNGNRISGIRIAVDKLRNDIDLALDIASKEMALNLEGMAVLDGASSRIEADMTVSCFKPYLYGLKGKMSDCDVSGAVRTSIVGVSADNLTGMLDLSDVNVKRPDGRRLHLSRLSVSIDTLRNAMSSSDAAEGQPLSRGIRIDSDWLDADINGVIHPSTLGREMSAMIGRVLPALVSSGAGWNPEPAGENDFSFELTVKGEEAPYAFFDAPVRPLTDIPVSGYINTSDGKASLKVSTPHLQQGKNKLIRDVAMDMDIDSFLGMAKLNTALIFPAKKGDAELVADIYAEHDKVNVNLGINPNMESVVKGNLSMAATISRLPDPFKPKGELAVRLDFLPSTVVVNDKTWDVSDGWADYSGKRISVQNFQVSHDQQYVKIEGTASESAEDMLKVRLNDIDLEYIFSILNINYVSFGGMASGEVVGRRLLTKKPDARTERLRVKNLSYNGALLGDGELASEYDVARQKVGIYAVLRDSLTRERRVSVDGGIWVTRDSLSFAFDANRVNVGIMKPFVAAFCSDIYGEASGRCQLYGTFSDIDLVGDLKADTLSMKLDFTNTWYHAGGDSVYLHEGMIEVPPLILYDDEKHTAEFSGWLRHRYFHDPEFSFRLKDANSLLCYNTNERINPLWYGTIYGSGHAQINGHPGLVEIEMNMTTEEDSKFTYVISDTEDVAQNTFLTFTDRRKESLAAATVDSIPDYLKKFRKKSEELEAGTSNVILSLKGTVTNDALVTLVMDPRSGDNITARGQGALQMDYNLASNDLRMIGTYVLDEGNYNFTLQDIIIKNFNIKRGSLIKFDGDPMRAILDITATYRVNTNLTDLDESFANDKELNRTNVPVDAVLLVDGPMTNPDITFDIELPSLMSDVERKVKSIVSTNDMMSRQIIYLLALNRFYTPEYTGGQGSGGQGSGRQTGGEWSSLASSTISSQLSNMLSQLTDKLDVAPSFRSDNGSFSDMEFDLALSSRLLNNRLLINGNFGYRDKNTSNTQFVGDFDIEYLLNKSGNLRLKAYNHFNDQNYYLRSALTTQGVGVVFKRDFDRLFHRKEKNSSRYTEETETDSIPSITVERPMSEMDMKQNADTLRGQ